MTIIDLIYCKLMVIHIGFSSGFLDDANLIYESRMNDFLVQINSSLMSKWIAEKLFPKLSVHFVIVMDSATHHCIAKYKRPSMYRENNYD